VSALPELSTQTRENLIRGCGILGLVLVAVMCGHCEDLALAATGPVDATAINPPMADPTPDASRPNQPATRVQTGNPLWAVPLRSLSITRERPLFSPSRRPPPPAVVAVPSAPAQPSPKPTEPDHPLLTLVGTIVGKTQSIGIFVDQVTKSVMRLKIGQDHAGWTLLAIRQRETVFQKDQQQATLVLPARSATAQAGAFVPELSPVAVRPGETWMDGDGQLISPPPSSREDGDAQSAGTPPSTWMDGDGQLVAPPSVQIGRSARH
jgi:hypothetical protein